MVPSGAATSSYRLSDDDNGDGLTNAIDAQPLLRFSAGLIDDFLGEGGGMDAERGRPASTRIGRFRRTLPGTQRQGDGCAAVRLECARAC